MWLHPWTAVNLLANEIDQVGRVWSRHIRISFKCTPKLVVCDMWVVYERGM